MSVTIPGWLVEVLLASTVWFALPITLWRVSNGVRRPQDLQRKGSVVKTWPEQLAFATAGPVGWGFLVIDYFNRKRSRAALRSIEERSKEYRERHPEAYPPEHPNCRSTLALDDIRWP